MSIQSKCIRVSYDLQKKIEKRKRNSGVINLIHIGGFDWNKRQLDILKSVFLCKKNGYKVKIKFLGNYNSEYGRQCINYVEEKGLNAEVEFVGYTNCVEDYLSNADYLIHPSYMESYPGVIVEAMANSVLVIATSTGGIPELLKHKVNGLLIYDYEVDSIYNSMMIAYNMSNEEYYEITKNAYYTYKKFHSNDSVGASLEKYYNDIINSKGAEKVMHKCELENIFHKFFDFVKIYTDSPITLKRIFYLYSANLNITRNSKKRSAIIWGAGKWGKEAINWCRILGVQLKGFYDTNKKGIYMNYQIVTDFQYLKNADIIFVAVTDLNSIQEIIYSLTKIGKIRNKDYYLMYNHPCLKTI